MAVTKQEHHTNTNVTNTRIIVKVCGALMFSTANYKLEKKSISAINICVTFQAMH